MPATPWPWPAPLDDGAARHLRAGLALPAVPLQAHTGKAVDLSAVTGRAVLFIYPWTGRPGHADPAGWDDIPGAHGSTPELAGIRDHYEGFAAAGLAIFALSGQASPWHQELASRLCLPFPLVSDLGLPFADALGLPTFEIGRSRYHRRLTLILLDGRIARCCYPVHQPPTHAADVLASLRA